MSHTAVKVHVSRFFLLTLVLGAFFLVVPPTPVAYAASITVNSNLGTKVDDGVCSLREAIENANNNAATWDDCEAGTYGADTIVLPGGLITLSAVDNGTGANATGLPVIQDDITINGNNTTIQRSNVGGTPDFRIFTVSSNHSLTLNNVTIQNGRSSVGGGSAGAGGGIWNNGTLVVNNSTITGNRTGDGGGGHGGGIANGLNATLTITNSTIGSNTAGNGGSGGGIYSAGTLNISNSTVNVNWIATGSAGKGGGIFNSGDTTMTLTNTTVSGNTAGNTAVIGGDGGGIYNGSNVTANITNSTISSNTTGYGLGTMSGQGGGIYHLGGTLTITSTTISGNHTGLSNTVYGSGGGIYSSGGVLNIINSTLNNNSTGTNAAGGGILSDGTLNVTGSTIASNSAGWSGGGITSNSSTATLKNTIVANNTAFSTPSTANCAGNIANGGNNLDSGTSCGWNSANGSLSSTNPLLGPLGNYGGPTQTMALQAGSPAIDGVTFNAPNDSLSTDQRGAARPQGARHDIGAYEAVFITVDDTSGGKGSPGCKLRDAITAANKDTAAGGCPGGFGPDIVVLPTSATITLSVVDNGAGIDTNGLPVITSTVAINGNNAIIQRSSADTTLAFRIFSVDPNGILTLNNVTVRNGRAPDGFSLSQPGGPGGGILSLGTLNINNSTISGNRSGNGNGGPGGSGGGIYIGIGGANITNSTISGNTTGNGGEGGDGAGIFAAGPILLSLTNSTITGNTTGTPNGVGGGLMIAPGTAAIVTSCTIANNTAGQTGGGISSEGGITLRNTIVANNTATTHANCDGTITNGGNNLDSGDTCGWGSANGSLSSTNPLLGPLGNYGGPTQTLLLGIGSPAIDGVTHSPPNSSPSTDQRGFARPHGAGYDIGAYEWYPSTYLPAIIKSSP